MRLTTHTALFVAISLVITGCGDRKLTGTGTGLTGTVTGNGADRRVTSTFWGYTDTDNKLAFIIFTDFDQETTVGAVGGDWSGEIGPKSGRPVMVFKGDADGLVIAGTEYGFKNGRIFLATAPNGILKINQIKLPISDANYETGIDRIAEQKDVQEFLNK